MAFYFVLCLFPRDVLDETWDLIESVSEGFLLPTLVLLQLFSISFEILGTSRFCKTMFLLSSHY